MGITEGERERRKGEMEKRVGCMSEWVEGRRESGRKLKYSVFTLLEIEISGYWSGMQEMVRVSYSSLSQVMIKR